MKKRTKSRSRATSPAASSGAVGWVIVLLIILIGLNAWELYLDHFAGETGQSEVSIDEVMTESEPPNQTQTAAAPEERVVESEQVVQKPPEKEEERDLPPDPENIRIQVLNGCGVRGIAARVRGVLRDRGFDVMSYGNASRLDFGQTHILIRAEGKFGERAAQVLAKSVGIAREQIQFEADPSLVDIDLTLVLGLDYRQLSL